MNRISIYDIIYLFRFGRGISALPYKHCFVCFKKFENIPISGSYEERETMMKSDQRIVDICEGCGGPRHSTCAQKRNFVSCPLCGSSDTIVGWI